jgi:hypothetical protein
LFVRQRLSHNITVLFDRSLVDCLLASNSVFDRPLVDLVVPGAGPKLDGLARGKGPSQVTWEFLKYGFLLLHLAGAKVN